VSSQLEETYISVVVVGTGIGVLLFVRMEHRRKTLLMLQETYVVVVVL